MSERTMAVPIETTLNIQYFIDVSCRGVPWPLPSKPALKYYILSMGHVGAYPGCSHRNHVKHTIFYRCIMSERTLAVPIETSVKNTIFYLWVMSDRTLAVPIETSVKNTILLSMGHVWMCSCNLHWKQYIFIFVAVLLRILWIRWNSGKIPWFL